MSLLPAETVRSDVQEEGGGQRGRSDAQLRRRPPRSSEQRYEQAFGRAPSPRLVRLMEDMIDESTVEAWRRRRDLLDRYFQSQIGRKAQADAQAGGIPGGGKQHGADVVLVVRKLKASEEGESDGRGCVPCRRSRDKAAHAASVRAELDTIMRSLRRAGLRTRVLQGSKGDAHEDLSYLVLSASDVRLEEQAERSHLDKKLKAEFRFGEAGFADYSRAQREIFERSANGELFTPLERQELVLAILEADERAHGAGLDLDALEARKVIVDYLMLPSVEAVRRLRDEWLFAWRAEPPLDQLREYLGLQIAFYFAWVSTYTNALGLLALVSAPVHAYGYYVRSVDNKLVPFYCALLCLWTTLFLESWKRRSAVLAFVWNAEDAILEAPARPEYLAHPSLTLQHGIFTARGFVSDPSLQDAQHEVKVYPRAWRVAAQLANLVLTATFMGGVVAAVVAIFGLKLVLRATRGSELVGEQAQTVSALLVTAFIALMNVVWASVSVRLNDWEVHRTDREYENALIVKSFAFRFVNSYASLFYLAFVAGARVSVFGLRGPDGELLRDSCPADVLRADGEPDCLLALYSQLEMIVLVSQGVRHILVLAPLAFSWLRACCAGESVERRSEGTLLSRIEAELARPEYEGTFAEYSEMAVQYGSMCLFAVAYPAAALICFVNNVLERKLDGMKVVLVCRRPRSGHADGIGMWEPIFRILSVLAVFTNCGILYLSSRSILEYVPNIGDQSRLLLILAIEHLLFGIKFLLRELIPDEPFWIVEERTRTRWRLDEIHLAEEAAARARAREGGEAALMWAAQLGPLGAVRMRALLVGGAALHARSCL
jgi:hypothetical protein